MLPSASNFKLLMVFTAAPQIYGASDSLVSISSISRVNPFLRFLLQMNYVERIKTGSAVKGRGKFNYQLWLYKWIERNFYFDEAFLRSLLAVKLLFNLTEIT